MSKYSTITIKDIKDLISPLCPITLYFNDIVIWDDTLDIDDPLNDYNLYKNFWIENADVLVDRYDVDINSFHHSIVKIWSVNE